MTEELMNFELPVEKSSIIKVIGVGGGGGNAVNHMYHHGIKDVNFVVCNTDAQALAKSPVTVKIQLGESSTEGRGAGNKPEVGRQAAVESIKEIEEILKCNTKMVFITAGMGGGTGTGAAPVIAEVAKELGILTVAIVTIPFRNEGKRRINQALEGISELEKHVDSLLVVNNEKIREIYGDLRVSEAFAKADDVLAIAAKGIAEIITVPGYINVDFADVETVMQNSGVAIMGSATAEGEDRAMRGIKEALSSPLLNNNDIRGAKNILLNITSGTDEITMDEIGMITDFVQDASGDDADLIWGNGMDESLGKKLNITIIATGFKANNTIPELYMRNKPKKDNIVLEEESTINQEKPKVEPVFEVHDKTEETEREEKRYEFEFDFPTNENGDEFIVRDKRSMEKEPDLFSVINQNNDKSTILKRASQNKFKEAGYNIKDDRENIEDLENEPAYVRKKVHIRNNNYSTEDNISKYSLSEDENYDVRIRPRPGNSYLHDNVD